MVCARRHPGDLHSVFPGARPAAQTLAQDDAGSGRRNAGMVHEADAPRGRARLFLRLSPLQEEKVAADIRAEFQRRDTAVLPPASLQPLLRRPSRRLESGYKDAGGKTAVSLRWHSA